MFIHWLCCSTRVQIVVNAKQLIVFVGVFFPPLKTLLIPRCLERNIKQTQLRSHLHGVFSCDR